MSEKKTELNDASKKETCPSSCENKNEEIKQSIPEENVQLNTEKKEKKPINSNDNINLFETSVYSMLNNFGNNATSKNNMIFFNDDEEKNQTNIHLNINDCNEKCDTKKKNENDNISNSKKINIIKNEKLENVPKAINFSGKKRERENLILKSNNNLLQNYFHSITQIINHKSKGKKIKLHEDINLANLNSKINYFKHDLYCELNRNSTSITNELEIIQKKLKNNNFKNFESNEFNDENQKNLLEIYNYVNSPKSNDLKTQINNFDSNKLYLEPKGNDLLNSSSEDNDLNIKSEMNWENEYFANSESNELYLENQENTEQNNQIESTCFETAGINKF